MRLNRGNGRTNYTEKVNKMSKQTRWLWGLGATLVLLVVAFGVIIRQQKVHYERQLTESVQLQKERMQEELEQLQADYGVQIAKMHGGKGYGERSIEISSDSLLAQLSREKARAEWLANELRTTKVTDNKRISALNAEITSLRKVLRSYIIQTDSLLQLNASLQQENAEVRSRYEASEEKADRLSAEKGELTARVTRAARLEASQISYAVLDKRGKKTRNINRISTLRFDLVLAKNVTAEPGARRIYLRIMNPSGQPMPSSSKERFSFENTTLESSASREVEYGGEALPVTLFWSVSETLLPGSYRADFFCDGAIIGQISFTLGK